MIYLLHLRSDSKYKSPNPAQMICIVADHAIHRLAQIHIYGPLCPKTTFRLVTA